MRSFSFTLLLFGLLGLLAVSVPAGWETPAANSLGEYERDLNNVEIAVDGLNLDLGSKEVDTSESGLVKLQTRGRGRSRPKKTKTSRPKKSKKSKTKKAKKAKKSKCNRNAKKGKHSKRAPPDACPAPTADYTGALRAAKRKDPRAQLVVGRTYMFIFKKSTIAHAQLIVGTVIEKSDGQLDFPAYAHGMVKETQRPGEPELSDMKEICRSLRGATCELDDFERWNCGRGSSERYSFKGEAIPQFAEPSYVKAIGSQLVARDLKYTVYYNNCWKFAKDAANVGKM